MRNIHTMALWFHLITWNWRAIIFFIWNIKSVCFCKYWIILFVQRKFMLLFRFSSSWNIYIHQSRNIAISTDVCMRTTIMFLLQHWFVLCPTQILQFAFNMRVRNLPCIYLFRFSPIENDFLEWIDVEIMWHAMWNMFN